MARDVAVNGRADLFFVVDALNRLNAEIGGHLRGGSGQYQECQLCVTSFRLLAVLTSWLGGGWRSSEPLNIVSLFANDRRQLLGFLLYFCGHRSFHPLDQHLLHDRDHEQSSDRDERQKCADPHAESSRRRLITHRDLSIVRGDVPGIRRSITDSTWLCMGDAKTRTDFERPPSGVKEIVTTRTPPLGGSPGFGSRCGE
jgi:hypothetical protein